MVPAVHIHTHVGSSDCAPRILHSVNWVIGVISHPVTQLNIPEAQGTQVYESMVPFPFLVQLQNCGKQLLLSSCPSVHVEQLDSHWTYFHEI